jgi:hypothetical protein
VKSLTYANFQYNKHMVALLDKSTLPSKIALRARGATSASELRRATAVKSSNCIEIQRFTYDARRRLGLCSNVGTEYYNSGPSCYEYSYSMPLNEVDPSGLESDLILSPNPLGQETSCRSKFLGFARCANKGSCKPAGNMIFHSAGTELRSGYRYYIGAAFQITFEHNANMFRSTCQCCCCSFGFVQRITEHTVLWKNGVVTGLGSVLNDGAWWSKPYYPSESKAYPCNPHVFGGNSLVMQDAPGVSVSNFFESPISIRTRGVTCAVCQSGPENGGANLRSATIYGCIEWRADVIGGWTANRKPKAKFGHRVASCSYARYIENMIIPGTKLQHLLALEVH